MKQEFYFQNTSKILSLKTQTREDTTTTKKKTIAQYLS